MVTYITMIKGETIDAFWQTSLTEAKLAYTVQDNIIVNYIIMKNERCERESFKP